MKDHFNFDSSIEGPKVAVGTESNFVNNVQLTLHKAAEESQSFVCIPLFHPRLRASQNDTSQRSFLTRSDMALPGIKDWNMNIIGKASSWLNLDSKDHKLRSLSEEALLKEYLFASHLGLQSIIIDHGCYSSPNFCCTLSRIIQSTSATSPQLWVRLPLQSLALVRTNEESKNSNHTLTPTLIDGWELWNSIRFSTEHNPRVFVVLELPVKFLHDDMSDSDFAAFIVRWAAEPVKAVVVHASSFFVNSKGKPQLSLKHKQVLRFFFRFDVNVIIKGSPKNAVNGNDNSITSSHHKAKLCNGKLMRNSAASEENALSMRSCIQYIERLCVSLEAPTSHTSSSWAPDDLVASALEGMSTSIVSRSSQMLPVISPQNEYPVDPQVLELYERFSYPYRDSLRSPLHPLSDNLDAETYTVMEQDPVKYEQYERALTLALRDVHKAMLLNSTTRVCMDTTDTTTHTASAKKKKRKISNSSDEIIDDEKHLYQQGSTSQSTSDPLPIVVMVVGAGRGPLVQATLNASTISGIPVRIVVVEKNFNAVVTLRNRFYHETSRVLVVHSDMRELQTSPSLLCILSKFVHGNESLHESRKNVDDMRKAIDRNSTKKSKRKGDPLAALSNPSAGYVVNPWNSTNHLISCTNSFTSSSSSSSALLSATSINASSQIKTNTSAFYTNIIVSELLGSWGDNECSPECLDAVEGFLHPFPGAGVMIPQSYESFIAPMTSHKLWTSARSFPPPAAPIGSSHNAHQGNGGVGIPCGLDSPYVVNFHCCHVLAEAQPLFKFEHPAKRITEEHTEPIRTAAESTPLPPSSTVSSGSENLNNIQQSLLTSSLSLPDHSRYHSCEFGIDLSPFGTYNTMPVPSFTTKTAATPVDEPTGKSKKSNKIKHSTKTDSQRKDDTEDNHSIALHSQQRSIHRSVVIHGFAGYFYCQLYKDVVFSTVPETHSPGMFSWFPMFLPLREPIHLQSPATLDQTMSNNSLAKVDQHNNVTSDNDASAANQKCVVPLRIEVWRRVQPKQRVWYEWGVSSPHPTVVQNTNGTSFCVPLN